MFRLPDRSTTDTRLAVAALTVGIPVTTSKKIHERTGEQITAYCLGDRSINNPAIITAQLMAWHQSGELEKKDPQHPFLDCLRALENRARLIAWIKDHTPCALSLSTDKRCHRTVYVTGQPLAPPHRAEGTLPDIAAAAALGILGVPIIRLSGDASHTLFHLPAVGFPLHDQPALESASILAAFGSGTMHRDTPEHPFLYAHAAVQNFRRMKAHMMREHPMIYFEDSRGTGRAALIRRDSPSAAFDHAEKMFKKPRWGR